MTFEWLNGQGLERVPLYLTTLAIGLLIGLDRERTPTAKAGLRTCALVALVGALSADLAQTFDAPSIIVAGLGAVALMMVAAYYHHHEAFHEWDSGTTTIAAVIACFLLGVTVVAASPKLAVILAVLITVLLHFKAELGAGVRNLDRRDLVSILQFAIVAFVVLPLLPDRNYDPYGALNPRDIWRMVVLIIGVSLAGYIALRFLGGRHSNFLLGLFGGLVSSTATTLSYARKARAVPDSVGAAADVIIAANVVLFARLAILATVVSQEILRVLAPVLGGALLAGAAVFFARRDSPAAVKGGELLTVRNPTELRAALVFAALYGTVVLLAAWLNDEWGSEGAYVVALITGFVDVDAIALSSLRLFGMAQLSALEATAAIVVAVSANAVFKLGIVSVAGGRALFYRCVPVIVATLIGSALVLAVIS